MEFTPTTMKSFLETSQQKGYVARLTEKDWRLEVSPVLFENFKNSIEADDDLVLLSTKQIKVKGVTVDELVDTLKDKGFSAEKVSLPVDHGQLETYAAISIEGTIKLLKEQPLEV